MILQASLLSAMLPLPSTQSCCLIGFRARDRSPVTLFCNFKLNFGTWLSPMLLHSCKLVSSDIESESSGIPTFGFSTGTALGTSLGTCNSKQSHAYAGRAFRLLFRNILMISYQVLYVKRDTHIFKTLDPRNIFLHPYHVSRSSSSWCNTVHG